MLTGADELVNYHLGTIGEITELSLPKDQRVGLCLAEAVLKPEHRRFGQGAVDYLELRLAILQMIERDVAVLALLIDPDGMSVRERATARILTR